jgi:hypothetical protein
MGRPIKSKYFGTQKGVGVGGETVSGVTIATVNPPNSTGTITVAFSGPSIAGGTTATGTVVKTGNTVTSVSISNAGSGYLTAPTVTFTGTSHVAYHTSATSALTSSVSDVIRCVAFLPTANGGTAPVFGDIREQVASKKYRVQTSEGTGVCRLVTTSTIAAGQMTILATDANTSTYYVRKLTARRAVLVQTTASVWGYAISSGAAAGWTLDTPSAGVVVIDNR